MDDICIYRIRLRGHVDQGETNATSPLEMRAEQTGADATLFTVRTDQSGLVGLLRHLHGLGFVFLFVSRVGTDEAETGSAIHKGVGC
jgi:hypothetical protein